MADAPFDINPDEVFAEVNDMVQVQASVRASAQKVADRARRLDPTAAISLRERTLPNGRFVVDVVADSGDSEYGTQAVQRRRTLRRARGGA